MSKTPSPPKITTRPNSNATRVQAIDGYLARIVKVETEIKDLRKTINENVDINDNNIENQVKHMDDLSDRIDQIEERVTELEYDDTASEATVERNPQSQTPNNNDDFDDDFDDDFYGPPVNRRIRVPETQPERQQLKY